MKLQEYIGRFFADCILRVLFSVLLKIFLDNSFLSLKLNLSTLESFGKAEKELGKDKIKILWGLVASAEV